MDKKIINYKILREIGLSGLETSVRNFMEKEWQPLGTPFFSPLGRGNNWCQVVVKYKQEEDQKESEDVCNCQDSCCPDCSDQAF